MPAVSRTTSQPLHCTTHGVLLPPLDITKKGPVDLSLRLPRAEWELYTILKRSNWKQLGPNCRLALLRDCAVQHRSWRQFTGRCQLWVMHEIAQISAEMNSPELANASLADQAASEFASAIGTVRLKSIARADPLLAQELTEFDIWSTVTHKHDASLYDEETGERRKKPKANTGFSFSRPPHDLRSELQALAEVAHLSSISPPDSPDSLNVDKRPTSSQSDLKMPGLGSPMSKRERTTTEQRSKRVRARDPLRASESMPDLRRSSRLAPLKPSGTEKIQPNSHDDVSKKLEDLTIKIEGAESESMAAGASNKALPAEHAYKIYFNDPEVEQVAEGKTQCCFNLVPTKSTEGKAALARQIRKKTLSAQIVRGFEGLKKRIAQIEGLPTAFVRVSAPGNEALSAKIKVEHAIEGCDVEIVEALRNEDEVIYELHIHDDTTTVAVTDMLKVGLARVKNIEWSIELPWDRVRAEVALAFPQYELSKEDFEELAPILAESCRLYDEAWKGLKTDRNVNEEDVIELMETESLTRYSGDLLSLKEGYARPLLEELVRQEPIELQAVMSDAVKAHRVLKEAIAPGSEWALQEFSQFGDEDDAFRTWLNDVPDDPGLAKGGLHFDPGIKSEAFVEAQARRAQMPYEFSLPANEVLGISQVHITFENFFKMNVALKLILEKLDVVWVENSFRNPNCCGYREVSIGVRVLVQDEVEAPPVEERKGSKDDAKKPPKKDEKPPPPPPEPPKRVHIAEVKLMHPIMRQPHKDTAKEDLDQKLDSVFEACGVEQSHIGMVIELVLNALDCTHGRLIRRATREFAYIVRHAQAVLTEIKEWRPDNVLEATKLAAFDMVSEVSQYAVAHDVPQAVVDRLLRRSVVGLDVEDGEWRQREAERLAKEETIRMEKEEVERKIREEEERKQREAEEAEAAEDAAIRAEKERKQKEAEARLADKEADIERKAAEREAAKQAKEAAEKRAKGISDAFLANHGLSGLDQKNENGKSALLLAVGEGSDVMLEEETITRAEMVESILLQGADIRTTRSEDGGTMMHEAGIYNAVDVLEVLMRWGMKVNVMCDDGQQPLHFAGASGGVGVIEALVAAGADVNAAATDGRTPLFEAARKDQAESAKLLIETGAKVNGKADNGQTAVHAAAIGNAPNSLAIILANGGDAKAKDNDGKTAKSYAKKNKKNDKVMELLADS